MVILCWLSACPGKVYEAFCRPPKHCLITFLYNFQASSPFPLLQLGHTHCPYSVNIPPLMHIDISFPLTAFSPGIVYHLISCQYPDVPVLSIPCTVFKPGARVLRPRAPGFLKLLWFARRYVCVCVCMCVCLCLCVRPRGH